MKSQDRSSILASLSALPPMPTEDQVFYLRMLARYMCSRKGIKTLTLAESAEIKGEQKQKENKTQAFLNRYTRGAQASADYRAFWKGVLKLHLEHKDQGIDLFDDPIMRQAFLHVYPGLNIKEPNDDTFIDAPLQNWFSIDKQRSSDVCRHHCGLWWIVRPSTTKSQSSSGAEFNLGLLNIVPQDVAKTELPLFKFYQPPSGSSGGGGFTSQGRMLSFHSDQIVLLGKRRGVQAMTQLSWKYAWDPDRQRHESSIHGVIFTVNTLGVLIQSYFHGCFIEKSEHLRGADFDASESLLRAFLGVKTEAELAEVPTTVHEIELLLKMASPDTDELPRGVSVLNGNRLPHRPVAPPAALERLKACPENGPILTIV